MDKNELPKKLKIAMIDKGILQKDIAADIGISKQALSNCFTHGNMTTARAAAIADVLQCDIVLLDRVTGKIY